MQGSLEQQVKEKRFAAASSVVAGFFLTVVKLLIGILTGSLGIIAEAAHSGLDLAAAIITLVAVRVSDRPADDTHLYGHGKVENLSALAETLLLLVTCGWILYEATRRLFFVNVEVDPSIWAFITMGISIVVDLSRSRALGRVAQKYGSQALEADALHFSTDIWSSAVVIVGLSVVYYGKTSGREAVFVRADALSAMIVAVIVVYVSVRLGRRAIDALLDRAPVGLSGRYETAVSRIKGVQKISRIRVRTVGNQVFVDLSVDVPRHLSFEESHEVTKKAREAVRLISPNADVIVHAHPSAENEGMLEVIQRMAASAHASVHNITTHFTQRGVWVDLDLEVDPSISFETAHHQATELESLLRAALRGGLMPSPLADVHVHVEPQSNGIEKGVEVSAAEAAAYAGRINALCTELKHSHGCQDVEVHRMKGKIYVSLHLLIDADRTVAEVHGIAEELESRLRLEYPQLGRVVIHTEPAQQSSGRG